MYAMFSNCLMILKSTNQYNILKRSPLDFHKVQVLDHAKLLLGADAEQHAVKLWDKGLLREEFGQTLIHEIATNIKRV